MKRLVSLLVFASISILSFAQTIQNGVVQEYNEKDAKTPLEGVELNVRSAGSTVSDKMGNFALSFLTLEPGEKVNVRRIEKLGYEVFNKEAVEQWNINPSTPFVIVMCRSELFKKIRDNYEKVSSESYARQLKKEEDALLKLKEEGELKEEEYQRHLFELRENYEQQLDNLDNYVDRFARIDLSELSSVEQEIIELLRSGRIDEAIVKYEEQNYVDQYIREVADIKEVSSAIDKLSSVQSQKELSRDSLYAAIERQVNALKLAGGKENFDRIGVILHDVAYADTTNVSNMYAYALFMFEQHQMKTAEMILSDLLIYEHIGDIEKIQVLYTLGVLKRTLGDFKSAELYLEQILKIGNEDFEMFSKYNAQGYHAIALIYSDKGEWGKALELLLKSKRLYELLLDNNYDVTKEYSRALNSLGVVYSSLGEFDFSIYNYQLAIELNDSNNYSILPWSTARMNLGCLYSNLYNYDMAKPMLESAIAELKGAVSFQPLKYSGDLAMCYNNLGTCLFACGQYDEALIQFYESQKYAEYLELNTDIIDYNIITCGLVNIANILTIQEKYEEAIRNYLLAVPILERYSKMGFAQSKSDLASVYCNLARTYSIIGYADKVNEFINKAYDEISSFNQDDVFLMVTKGLILSYIGEIHRTVFGDFEQARVMYQESLQIMKKLSEIDNSYLADLGQVYYDIAASYLMEEKLDDALSYIEKAIETVPSNLHFLDGKGEVLIAAGKRDEAKQILETILDLNPDVDLETIYLYKLLNQDNK